MLGAATGQSMRLDGFEAGRDAANEAAQKLGQRSADLVMVFSATGYTQTSVLEGIRAVFEVSPITGCSAEGLVTREGACEDAHFVGVLAMSSKRLEYHTFLAGGAAEDPARCATDVLEQLSQAPLDEGGLLLLFPPGLNCDITELLNSLTSELPSSVVVCGGAAGNLFTAGALEVNPTFQYRDEQAATESVAGVFIGGDIDVVTEVSHGCLPIGLEMEVTSATGSLVKAIDGRPAVEVFEQYLPEKATEFDYGDLIHLSVGLKLPEAIEHDYNDYLIRTPGVVDWEAGHVFFSGQIEEGTRIQMVHRDPERIRDSAGWCAEKLRQSRDQQPLIVFQFDCSGRGRFLFGDRTTEMAVEPILEQFSEDIPYFGFHTFGEIAPLGGQARFHNHTVVLCGIYHRDRGE